MKPKPKTKAKKRRKYKDEILFMEQNIDDFHSDIWLPPHNLPVNIVKNNPSWFSIKESKSINTDFINHDIDPDPYEFELYKSKKILLDLTNRQKKIINKWLKSSICMYNETLKYIKEQFLEDSDFYPNFYKVRSALNKIKQKICNFDGSIKIHDLDSTIQLVCTNYKSAITNFQNGNIKHFRMRYWKHNKSIKIMGLEKNNFKNGTIREKILGQVKCFYNNSRCYTDNIDCDCKLMHDTIENKYYLLVPKMLKEKEIEDRSEMISLDPGTKTFLTGITEDKVVEIGKECKAIIRKYLKRTDKINNNKEIPEKKKRKLEKVYNRKIKNKVDELHWKTIDYLTKNYDKILIGDLSSKKVVNNKTSNLSDMEKRIILRFNFYVLRKRLEYKCALRKCEYKKVDERYTSKMCSECGELKNDLGNDRIFECERCERVIGRDVNGARNIYIKSIERED